IAGSFARVSVCSIIVCTPSRACGNWRASRAVAPAASTRGTESAAAAETRLRSCLVHRHRTRVVLLAVQALDRGLRGLVICHLDETEALRAARVAVHDDRRGLDAAELPEQCLQVFLGRVVTEIADVKFLRHLGFWTLSE